LKAGQCGSSVVSLIRNGQHFVPESQIHRERFFRFDVVLDVGAEKSFPQSDVQRQRVGGSREASRLIGKKLNQGVEAECSIDVAGRDFVVLHPFDLPAEFDGMPSMSEDGVIAPLIRIPVEGPAA